MKIAFTYNIQLNPTEEEAEFDRPETIASITEALRGMNHEVETVDVAGPASRLVARLEALNPDLVFNTAEGTQGRFREAFYPALFERLSLPFTGSDAYVCALTLDKHLTKMMVAAHDIKTPRWLFISEPPQITALSNSNFSYPLIVKPNFEGSSMGISIHSVVETPEALKARAEELLSKYPSGIIVEEFIAGSDLTVPFLEKASPARCGILEPAQYEFDTEFSSTRKYQIYDFDMKSIHYDAVHVRVPANITADQRERAMTASRRIVNTFGIRDAARIDFRLGHDGELYFIEINALPSLEPGSSLFVAAALDGFETMDKVIGAMVQSSSERFNLPAKITKSLKRGKVRVGFTFNMQRIQKSLENGGDADAEYDAPETISAIRQAIESHGHEVVELEATPELPSILPNAGVDVVFNAAEGLVGRTRESQVPALLELLGIPYTGSDAATMSLALDKALAKRLVSQAGLKTPPYIVMSSGKERLPKAFSFPAIVKPLAEGSSKGIIRKSVVESEEELRSFVQESISRYRQEVIVEEYLPGREFTVALLGEKRPRALPIMEVVFSNQEQKYLLYSYESKFFENDVHFQVPAKVEPSLARELERVARNVFMILGCRDLARVDLRLDANGQVNFVECNPLPGLTPGFSDFCVIAEAAGMTYRTLIGEILAPALRRLREKNREKKIEGRI